MKIEDYKTYQLCYVESMRLYFTDNFSDQWGDDWNDYPYEMNSGEPYEDNDHHIFKLYYYGEDFTTPYVKGDYSVEEINKDSVAWLISKKYGIYLHAGYTVEKVMSLFKEKCPENLFLPMNLINNL
jgi:hypothetical protein